MKELKEKLEEEGHQKKKEQEAKVMVEKELTALLGKVETVGNMHVCIAYKTHAAES